MDKVWQNDGESLRAFNFRVKKAPFYLYIDEFQNFATQSFIETLSEARKYRLSLILAHQNLSQMPKELQASVLANCGVVSCFRVSREDAQIGVKYFKDRKKIAREYKERLERLTASKEPKTFREPKKKEIKT